MADTVRVTQADRDAAAEIYANIRDHDYAGWVRQGTNATGDADRAIQLCARHRLASTQPAPAFPREEVMNALWHGQQDHLRARGMGGSLGDLPQSRTDLRAMYGAMVDRIAALLQGKQP